MVPGANDYLSFVRNEYQDMTLDRKDYLYVTIQFILFAAYILPIRFLDWPVVVCPPINRTFEQFGLNNRLSYQYLCISEMRPTVDSHTEGCVR